MPSGAQEGAAEMVETPKTVEVNVVMGAQLRAIVRSALIHVKNKVRETLAEDMAVPTVDDIIDQELEKWPLSAEPQDTLAEWLFKRFNEYGNWNRLYPMDKLFWEHEAAAVRRAVGRGGFKTSPEEVEISHPIGDLHEAHANSGGEVKGYRQLDLKHAESLGEAIRIAVGAASMTWTNMQGAGVFKSEVALDIATQLEHHFFTLLQVGRAQMMERHQALSDHLQHSLDKGNPLIHAKQTRDILTGRSTPEDYRSYLQPAPDSVDQEGDKYVAEMDRTQGPDPSRG